MTIKEAIQRIQIHSEILIKKQPFAVYTTEALNMAVKSLEKQIPKKPIKKNPICYARTKDGCYIYLAFNTPNAIEQDYFEVTESYDSIIEKIAQATIINAYAQVQGGY